MYTMSQTLSYFHFLCFYRICASWHYWVYTLYTLAYKSVYELYNYYQFPFYTTKVIWNISAFLLQQTKSRSATSIITVPFVSPDPIFPFSLGLTVTNICTRTDEVMTMEVAQKCLADLNKCAELVLNIGDQPFMPCKFPACASSPYHWKLSPVSAIAKKKLLFFY